MTTYVTPVNPNWRYSGGYDHPYYGNRTDLILREQLIAQQRAQMGYGGQPRRPRNYIDNVDHRLYTTQSIGQVMSYQARYQRGEIAGPNFHRGWSPPGRNTPGYEGWGYPSQRPQAFVSRVMNAPYAPRQIVYQTFNYTTRRYA